MGEADLKWKQCALGGVKEGVPTGWGVVVCEKAFLSVTKTVIEFCHQAIGVVDWCQAEVLVVLYILVYPHQFFCVPGL